jgi:adenine-specific DNA-methyltransferase
MRQLAQKLSYEFSYENLEEFLIIKNPDFTVLRQRLYDLEENLNEIFPIEQAYKFAEVKLKDNVQFIVFVIKTNEPLTERRSKKKQYEVAKRLLGTSFVNAGLFIFHDEEGNFRFSLVYRISQGTRAEFSYYKRFTFYVSPQLNNKTFILQIGYCNFATFDEIKKAFSIEPVTKQFYDEIQTWYLWAMDNVKFPDDYKYSENPEKDREIRNATNLIRLITRIIFIWFLKEKGLIPEILFNERDLKEIVKDFGNKHNYYNAILQNLFFATLNSKIEQRGWAKNEGFPKNKSNYGVKTLFRYEDKFLINENEVLQLFKEIPFLNGGLFDCLDKEDEKGTVIYIDGFSRNPKKQAIIPDYLFFQENELRINLSNYGLGANKTFRGLINILRSYNFTTDEATPIDQEIALDPELLGKVFENLLASYNPETATTARKATGSYYTPREIVDYMVEESLREYLKTKLPDIDEDKLDILLSYSEKVPDFSDEEKQEIISAIDEIKILDPACGSGAFPMGILHKLVYILQKIDPDNKLWYELQYQKALKASEQVFKEKDKLEREQMLKEINEAFDESINYPDYARKLYLIENCIYGVDIQQIAIQISKLRFFISLVLDQKVDRTKENFGIRPLPNLETKFVSANTLIGLEKPRQLNIRSPEIENKEKELKDIRHRYFTAKTRTEKLKLQERDREIRKKIAQLLINDGWGEQTAHKIASFDLFDQNASADWFDPEWMFGVVDGFDIVIGNPPYGADISKYKDYVESNFRFFETRKNSASLFIEKSFELLKQEGVLAYVIPKSITFVESWKKTRDLVYKNNRLLVLIDLTKAFENVKLEQIILICQKTKNDSYFYKTGDFWDGNIRINTKIKTEVADKLEVFPMYTDEIKMSILNKLLENSVKLYSISKTFRGLPYQNKISEDGYLILRGKNINKYLIYREIDKVNLTISELNKPKVKQLMKPKIISQRIVAHVMNPFDRIIIMATYDKKGFLTLDTVMNTFLTDNSFSYEYILGILNSRLAEWFYYWFVYNRAIRTMDFDESYIGKLPIKKITPKNQPIADQIIALVDQILSSKQQNPDADTSHLEHQIDQLAYKLYDLKEEEIKIIEGGKWK